MRDRSRLPSLSAASKSCARSSIAPTISGGTAGASTGWPVSNRRIPTLVRGDTDAPCLHDQSCLGSDGLGMREKQALRHTSFARSRASMAVIRARMPERWLGRIRDHMSSEEGVGAGNSRWCGCRSTSSCRRQCRGASPGRRGCAPLPRGGGALDRPRSLSAWAARRRRSRPVSATDGGEGAGGEGALCRPVPRLRGLHAAARRQAGCVRVLQTLSSGRDPAQVDARVGGRCDGAVAGALRSAAVLLRLVAHPRQAV